MDDRRSRFDIAQTMADAAEALNLLGSLEDVLDAVAYAARDAVPGFDHVGISVIRRDGAVTTMASTDRLVRTLDTLQYKVDEGPCLDAMRRETLVLVEELRHHAHSWPTYVPRAADAGVRSQMGVRLSSGGQTFGGLNFYSTVADTIDPEAPRRAALFARHAAVALEHARHSEEVRDDLPARQLIGQAVGILMERFELTENRAVYLLLRVAVSGNRELRAVAREVVDRVNARAEPIARGDQRTS